MEDTLINFETAKLAKEKGFDEKVYREYDKSGYLRCTSKSADVVLGPYDELLKSTEYPAPTQSLLQKWLREVHNIEIYVHKFKPNGAYPKGYYCVSRPLIHYSNEMKDWIFTNFKTYEEALEVGLQEGLKLIKI